MIKLSLQFSISLFGKNWPLHRKTDNSDFFAAARQTIDTLTATRAKSTVDNYRTALRSLTLFVGTSLPVGRLDCNLIEGYQHWLTDKGITQNTVSCYMRSLRSIIQKTWPETDIHQLFKGVFTGKEHTEKRAVPVDDINRLRLLKLPRRSPLAFARDLFQFSVYAQGMPFVDIAHLRKSQISDGYIVYHRHKTGQRICVKLESQMQQIINRYQVADSPYVFPILTSDDSRQTAQAYETARARYNRHLNVLSRLAHTQRKLTSYVARHSWASMAYHANVSLPVISKALGHTSPSTTQTYLQSIDDDSIASANNFLIRHLFSSFSRSVNRSPTGVSAERTSPPAADGPIH